MPTVAQLDAEVTQRCGLVLHDAGLFLRALDSSVDPAVAITPVVREGLRRGFVAVGSTAADPRTLADSDVATLSAFAVERVIDVAELYSLQQALLGWWRVTRKEQPPLAPTPMAGGWRVDQRKGVADRVAALKEVVREPYREPEGPVFAIHTW